MLPSFCAATGMTHSDLRGRRASGASFVLILFCGTIWSCDSQTSM